MRKIETVLVTGGAGFIGSHTVLELVEAGYNVIAIDNFLNAVRDEGNGSQAISLKRVEELTGKKIDFFEVDTCDRNQLNELFKKYKFDAVIHLASLKAVSESCEKPLEYYSNNLIGGLNIMQACREFGVKNFVFSSSATVYGPPSKLPITEDDPTGQGLTNPYGQTKYMLEQILFDLHRSEPDWNIVILRFFNPVGAHESGRIGEDPRGVPNNLMPYISQVAIGKLPFVRIYGTRFDTPDGTGMRDYIHIVDLAKGHVAALDYIRETVGGCCLPFNLGTGKAYSVLQMVRAVERASSTTIATRDDQPRTGDVASVYCDPRLAATQLKWTARLGLDDMCRDLWRWQSNNPNGFLSADELVSGESNDA